MMDFNPAEEPGSALARAMAAIPAAATGLAQAWAALLRDEPRADGRLSAALAAAALAEARVWMLSDGRLDPVVPMPWCSLEAAQARRAERNRAAAVPAVHYTGHRLLKGTLSAGAVPDRAHSRQRSHEMA